MGGAPPPTGRFGTLRQSSDCTRDGVGCGQSWPLRGPMRGLPDRPVSPVREVEMQPWFGSDLLVDRLSGLGVRYLALNPGASIRGLHDSLVNPPGRAPEPILALHEEIAVAVAHGFSKAGGGTMAVAVHDTVGLLHASMALFNAWADRASVLVYVGTGPLDAARRRPWIDWIHTVNDQGALVRDFTVWNDQPTSPEALLASTDRAWAEIHRPPVGPGLISLDVDLQELPV